MMFLSRTNIVYLVVVFLLLAVGGAAIGGNIEATGSEHIDLSGEIMEDVESDLDGTEGFRARVAMSFWNMISVPMLFAIEFGYEAGIWMTSTLGVRITKTVLNGTLLLATGLYLLKVYRLVSRDRGGSV